MTGNEHYFKPFPCACCGFFTRDEDHLGDYGICPVCGWEDDWSQEEFPNTSGANKASLIEARICFEKHGCSELRRKPWCRPPLPEEFPPKVFPLREQGIPDSVDFGNAGTAHEFYGDRSEKVISIDKKGKKK